MHGAARRVALVCCRLTRARVCRVAAQAPRRGLGAAPRAAPSASSGSDSDSDSDGGAGDASGVLRRGEALGRDGIFVSGTPPAASSVLRTHAPSQAHAGSLTLHPAAGTRAELALARTLAKDKWGRFGGRDGKMARIAAAEAAAAAKAGRAHAPAAPAAAAAAAETAEEAAARKQRRKAEKAERLAEAAAAAAASRKRARAPSPPPPPPAAAAAAPSGAPPAPATWWSRLFHCAGDLAGAEREIKPARPRGFCEADQEALYTDAHEGKTEGRVGLGRRSGTNPLVIGGARWAGNRVAFDAAAEGEEEGEEEGEAAAVAEDTDAEEDGVALAAAVGGLKWRKLAAAALAAAPKGKLSDRKLRHATLAAAAAKLGWAEDAHEGEDANAEALRAAYDAADVAAGRRFARLPCGRVSLAAAGEEEEAAAPAEEEEAPPEKRKSKKSKKERAK
jgi:hypothetical protein